MLTRRIDTPTRFTRSDVPRLVIAGGILILALTAILGVDILPDQPLDAAEGQLATRDILAPKAIDFESKVQTDQARAAASAAVPFQYSFTTENAIAIAAAQQLGFESRVDADRHHVRGDRDLRGRQEGPAQERRARSLGPGEGDARRPRRRALGRRPHRGGTGPRRDRADRIARYRGRRDPDAPVRPDGGRARRGGTDARRRAHRAAGRAELVAQPAAHDDRAGSGGGRGRTRPGHDPPGRGHRPQRLAVRGHGHREDRRPRPPRGAT